MPAVSNRGNRMPASPIRKLAPYADAAEKRGTRIYRLNIGQPDIASPTEFWAGMKRFEGAYVPYGPSDGLPSLRAKLLADYGKRGIALEPGQLIVTTAGSEALTIAMIACCNPGDQVIVPEPMYANYIGFASAVEVEVVPLTTRIENDFALPSAAEFAGKVTSRTKAILVCNPGNPTGTIVRHEELLALRDIALEHDLFLIADEVYREFNYSSEPLTSVLQLEGLEQHAVMIDSVSKRFSLCGARLGNICSRNPAVMDAAMRYCQARLSPPTLEQYGVEAALDAPQTYFDGVRAEYVKRRDLVVEVLSGVPGVKVPKIDGAFYATVRLPIDSADRFCQWLLESFSEGGETVMLAPASGFYATPGLGEDEVRIAYVLKEEDLRRALSLLVAALGQYPGKTA